MKKEYLKILIINVIIFFCENLYAHGLEIVIKTFIINFIFQIISAFLIGFIIILLNNLIFNQRVINKLYVIIGSVLGSILSIVIYVLVLILIFDAMPGLSFNFVITVSWIVFLLITGIGAFIGFFYKK